MDNWYIAFLSIVIILSGCKRRNQPDDSKVLAADESSVSALEIRLEGEGNYELGGGTVDFPNKCELVIYVTNAYDHGEMTKNSSPGEGRGWFYVRAEKPAGDGCIRKKSIAWKITGEDLANLKHYRKGRLNIAYSHIANSPSASDLRLFYGAINLNEIWEDSNTEEMGFQFYKSLTGEGMWPTLTTSGNGKVKFVKIADPKVPVVLKPNN